MSDKQKLSVGQKLWFVSAYGDHEGSWIVVKKVGRKWALLDVLDFADWRCDMETLEIDRGSRGSPGTCFRTPEDAEQARLAVERVKQEWKEWGDLRNLVGYHKPAHLSAAQIRQCIDIIKPPKAEGAE